ncbi:hypothetical protein [Methanospirillum hungatei]|uniref:hypothetical protein n=1 Tax=Methanospirillum hungatei TaxID=2203 RepID=UPI00005E14A1|nr:hypothetical protein [Methanospirillum hungatei]
MREKNNSSKTLPAISPLKRIGIPGMNVFSSGTVHEWESDSSKPLTFTRTCIFWMIRGNRQQVVFLDPHGLAHDTDKDREKHNLCKNIRKDYEPFIQKRLKDKGITTEILLDAYIISDTDQKTVSETFRGMPTKSHVVYQKNPGYIREICEGLAIVQLDT